MKRKTKIILGIGALVVVTGAHGVNNDRDGFVTLQQSQGRGLYCTFSGRADQNEFAGPNFAEESVYSRLRKGI